MQVRTRSLKRDTLAYGAAMAVDRAIGIALLPILTARMDRSTFGAWTQVLTTFALLSNVLELGFFHSLAQYVPGAKRGDIRRILHGVLGIVLVNGIIFVALSSFFPRVLSNLVFGDQSQMGAILAGSVFIVTESLFEILVLGFLRADNRVALCAFYYAAKSVLRLLLLWEGLVSGSGLAGLLWRLSLSNIVLMAAVYFLHVLTTLHGPAETITKGFWRKAVMHSGAIVVSSNLAWANASLSRFFIVHMLGLSSLGLYAANYSLASIVSLSYLVINFTAIPHINAAWNARNAERTVSILTSSIEYYLFISIPMAVGLGLFYEPVAQLLIRGEFYPDQLLMWTLIAAILLMGLDQLLSFATYMGNSRLSVATRTASLLANLTIVSLFLRPYGLSAVAIGIIVASLIVVAVSVIYLNRLCGFLFPWRLVGWLVAAGMVMAIVSASLFHWLGSPSLLTAVLSGFVGLLAYLLAEFARDRSICRQALQRIR